MVLMDPKGALLAYEDDASLTVIPDGISMEFAVHMVFFINDGVGASSDGRYLMDGE